MNNAPLQESRQVTRTFGWASFLHDMGSDMVGSVWPLFIKQVLGASTTTLGLIDGLGDAIVSLSQVGSGYLSDRWRKRKIFIWLGYLMGGLSKVGYAVATTSSALIPLRALDRAGKMRGSPRDAMIADVSTNENRGRNFGFLRSMDNLGAVVGIIISILLVDALGFRRLFMLAAVPSALATLLVVFYVRERPMPHVNLYRGFTFKYFSQEAWLVLASSAAFSLGAFSYSFLLLYGRGVGFSIGAVPVLYLLFTAVASLGSLPFGKLADKIGRTKVLAISYALWGVTCGLFIVRPDFLGVVIGFVLYGLHKAALEPSQKALVSELAPPEFRASTLGGFQLVVGMCALPASLAAGFLWDRFGALSPLYLSISLTLIALVVLAAARPARRVTQSRL